jgi:hypothetical protein
VIDSRKTKQEEPDVKAQSIKKITGKFG